MEKVALLPCPFCGSADVRVYQVPYERAYEAMCASPSCGAVIGESATPGIVTEAWNRRAPHPAEAKLARLRKDGDALLYALDPAQRLRPGDQYDQLQKAITRFRTALADTEDEGGENGA